MKDDVTYGKQQLAAEAIAKKHGLAPIMTKLDNGKVVIGKAASQQLENTRSVLSKANMKNMLLMREKETLTKDQQQKQNIMEEAEKKSWKKRSSDLS